MPLLSVVLPTYNERENLPAMCEALRVAIAPTGFEYELIFVDDRSTDGTVELLHQLHAADPAIKYIIMSRRYGDQPCLMAGLERCLGDVEITMDADLQHPPSYIPAMLQAWREGAEVLAMRREEAGHASWLKGWTEIAFYRLMDFLADTPIIYRFAGFALLDRKAIDALKQFSEREPFLRGLVPWVGYRRQEMTYREEERRAGRSKYSLGRMWRLAMTGFTSLSTAPLYFILYAGLALTLIAALAGIGLVVLTARAAAPETSWVIAWAATFLGGVQLVAVGTLGVYLGKVLLEVRRRPAYIVAELGGFNRD